MTQGIRRAGARMPRVAPVWVLSLLLLGCGTKTLAIPPNVPVPVVEPAPVSVGVFYSETLRNHTCTIGKDYVEIGRHTWKAAMGPPSIAMFDRLLAAMFRKTETADTRPGAAPTPRDVIEVRLSEFNGCDVRPPIIGTTTVRIGYEAILWSAQGRELTRWQGRGQAGPGDSLYDYLETFSGPLQILTGSKPRVIAYLAALTSLAMRDAATNFLLNFEKNSVVQARLKK